MAKRFTDTDKWRKPWYRALHFKAKMVWGYLTDNCDHAGIWPAAFDLLTSDVGFTVTPDDLEEWFGDKLIPFEDKYFIPGFIEFQYGDLSEGSKPHLSVIRTLVKNGIDPKNLTLSKGYPKGMDTLKDKDKEKEKEKEGGVGETTENVSQKDLEALYRLYPRKAGSSAGLKRLKADIKGGAKIKDISQALANFIAHHKREKTEKNFIPHFKTWANHWRDCLDPSYGQSESFAETDKPWRTMAEILAEEESREDL